MPPTDANPAVAHPCILCAKTLPPEQLVATEALPRSLTAYLAQAYPAQWTREGYISHDCLDRVRLEYVTKELKEERGALSAVETDVIRLALEHESMARNLAEHFQTALTVGERMADRLAAWAGSWAFIGIFTLLLFVWVGLNVLLLNNQGFDPYPFILLNLGLSALAALQAPVIMMSQRRIEERDRMQAEEDFRTNLKAELEVAQLHEKLDHLLHVQWERMAALQQIQIDMLAELRQAQK